MLPANFSVLHNETAEVIETVTVFQVPPPALTEEQVNMFIMAGSWISFFLIG